MRRLVLCGLVVVLCVGEVALLGSDVVADVSGNGGSAVPDDVAPLDPDEPVGDSVPDSAVDAVRSAPACEKTYDNGTSSDTSDDYVLKQESTATNGDRTCVYTRTVSHDEYPVAVDCPQTLSGGYTLTTETTTSCSYLKVTPGTVNAERSVSYSCDQRTGWTVRRSGDECIYSKTVPRTLNAIPAVYVCPAVDTYGPGVLQGTTCRYTRSGRTTLLAKVQKRWRCPANPPTFTLTDVDHNRGRCIYSRSGETTRDAGYLPMFGNVGKCPTAPATFTYSKRVTHSVAHVVCHYTRSRTTSRAYESYNQLTCPPAPETYSSDRRIGRTCVYTRSTSTTAPATLRSVSRCPPVPVGQKWDRRVGNTCYYKEIVTETRSARSKTTYSCRSGTLVGTKCETKTETRKTEARAYECPDAESGETLAEKGSGSSKTCTYSKTETLKRTKKALIALATPTGAKANGHSYTTYTTGQSSLEWSPVPNATEYSVILDRDDGTSTDIHTWNGSVTSATIKGLMLNTLYRVRVRAHRNSVQSQWSTPIYTYPTTIPAGRGSLIGPMPIGHYRPTKGYHYALCTNMAPKDTLSESPTICYLAKDHQRRGSYLELLHKQDGHGRGS